jgi:hypothetical protein
LDHANVALLYIAGAIAVVIAVFAFWSSRVNRNLRALEADLSNAKETDARTAQQRLEIGLAAQQERAANAESELLRLKDLTRPRAFTDEQLNQLSRVLPKITEKFPIEIATPASNPPATDSAELCTRQLEKVFKDAGWRVSLSSAQDVLANGMRINLFMKDATRPPAMTTILESFERLGQYHRLVSMENVDPKNELRARITVGLDPRLY